MTNQDKIKDIFQIPFVVLPTFLIYIGSILGTILSFLVGAGYILPFGLKAFNLLDIFSFDLSVFNYWYLTIPITILCGILSSFCCYTMFTVVHDAVHRSVSYNKYVNDFFGMTAIIWLGPTSNWYGFRRLHLIHHSHTNDKDVDPDTYSSTKGPGGKYLTPFRWLTLDLSYWAYLLPQLHKQPTHEIIHFVVYESIMALLIVHSCLNGYFSYLLQYWIIPARIAVFLLAIFFDYIPHEPYLIKRSVDKYKTTAYIDTPNFVRPFWSLISYNQDYHAIHHLYPKAPFCKYKELWNIYKHDLLNKKGVPVREYLKILNKLKLN